MTAEDKQKIIAYIHQYAWEYGRLWNTTLSDDKKEEIISERIKTPEEFLNDNFNNENK